MSGERPVQRSGGGIVSRGGARSSPREAATMAEAMRAWRRRWTSGVAIVTTAEPDGSLRGITLSALMPVSLDPPHLAFSVAAEGEFAAILRDTGRCAVHVLDRDGEFLAERFAGRAPLPDRRFGGIAHEIRDGVPVLAGALAWATGGVLSIEPVGDALLMVMRVEAIEVGEDTDDPLLSYEGRYRGLEAS